MTGPDDDTEQRAERVQAQAAALPLDQVAELAAQAVAHGGTPGMPIEEVRDLARTAVEQARHVTELLERLSSLIAPQPPGGDQRE